MPSTLATSVADSVLDLAVTLLRFRPVGYCSCTFEANLGVVVQVQQHHGLPGPLMSQ
jgi:hypothetical protein